MPSIDRPSGASEIFYVMAAEQEYGPALKARIQPLLTGVGPVEAAVSVTSKLAELKLANSLPRLVVSLGSAGARRLPQLEVFQAKGITYRDMDASALGFQRGETPFLGLPAQFKLGWVVPGIPLATLSTGGNVVSGTGYDHIDADMVDMESYAILRACQHFALPLIVLRGISDGAEEVRAIDDWTRYLHVIDERLARAVDRLEEALAAGSIKTT